MSGAVTICPTNDISGTSDQEKIVFSVWSSIWGSDICLKSKIDWLAFKREAESDGTNWMVLRLYFKQQKVGATNL